MYFSIIKKYCLLHSICTIKSASVGTKSFLWSLPFSHDNWTSITFLPVSICILIISTNNTINLSGFILYATLSREPLVRTLKRIWSPPLECNAFSKGSFLVVKAVIVKRIALRVRQTQTSSPKPATFCAIFGFSTTFSKLWITRDKNSPYLIWLLWGSDMVRHMKACDSFCHILILIIIVVIPLQSKCAINNCLNGGHGRKRWWD